MIEYYLNWCGPINYDWIKINGEDWCGGRIDVSATEDNPYGDEIGVPNMNCEDWESLSLWLRELKTETIWTLRQIIDEYQKTNPKIRWFNNKLCDEGQNRSQKLEEE